MIKTIEEQKLEKHVHTKAKEFLKAVELDFDELYGKRFDICITSENEIHAFAGSKFMTIFIPQKEITTSKFIPCMAHQIGHMVIWLKNPKGSLIARKIAYLSRFFKKKRKWFLRFSFSIPQILSMIDGARVTEEVRADRIGMKILKRCGYDPTLILKDVIPDRVKFRTEKSLIQKIWLYYVNTVRRNQARDVPLLKQ